MLVLVTACGAQTVPATVVLDLRATTTTAMLLPATSTRSDLLLVEEDWDRPNPPNEIHERELQAHFVWLSREGDRIKVAQNETIIAGLHGRNAFVRNAAT